MCGNEKIKFIFSLCRADRSVTLIIRRTLWLLNTQSANFSLVTDTLSLGDRTIDNMDRHAIQTRPRQQMLDHSSGPKSKPEPTFDLTQNANVTALIGKTAYLTCRVRNLGDKTVRVHYFALWIINYETKILSIYVTGVSPTWISYNYYIEESLF